MTGAELSQIQVDAALAGKRLDIALAEAGAIGSRSQAKTLIEEGHVTVNGKPATKAGHIVHEGETILVRHPEVKKLDLSPREVGIRILFEDEQLAVLEKPAGISVHPSETETGDTVVHGLLHALKTLSSVGGVERPGIVHRIDKGTSGILVVSKTDAAHAGLSAQFKAHSIDRKYQALVYGDLSKKGMSGTITTMYGRHPVHRKRMTGRVSQGRKAVTHWRVLEKFGDLTLVECRLETGRTHQIRVHLSELGFPLVGDKLYGDHERKARALAKVNPDLSEAAAGLSHQLLHAFHLGFVHPVTGKRLSFDSRLPLDFERVLSLARVATAG